MDRNTSWDPAFGSGITVTDLSTGNSVRASQQGAVMSTPSSIIYQDGGGRFATLGGLKSDEVSFLTSKHSKE